MWYGYFEEDKSNRIVFDFLQENLLFLLTSFYSYRDTEKNKCFKLNCILS